MYNVCTIELFTHNFDQFKCSLSDGVLNLKLIISLGELVLEF